MKNFKIKLFLSLSIFISYIEATDYANARFDNFVSGQGVNEVLAEAQTIICALSRMGTEDLAGDGSYKATIYINECEQAAAEASDGSEATSAPSSATDSSSTSASATAATGDAAPEIDVVFVNTGFTTASTQTTKGWIVNDKPWNDQTNPEPKNILYLLNEQTAPVSDSNKFGDFTLRYQLATFGNTQADLPEWYTCPDPDSDQYKWSWCADGADLGRAILIASGGSIKFKSDVQSQPQQNVVADYFDNGDIAGIYTRSSGFMDESLRNPSCDEVGYNEDGSWDHDAYWECQPEEYRNSNVQILGIFSFGIAAESKSYCTKLTELYEVDWAVRDEETQQPKLVPYTLTDAAKAYLGNRDDWDTEEKCFSIDKADAMRNIWDYGVFNSDGSKYKSDNQAFPIRTSVEVDDVTRRVHGYASYWGVHVDHEYQPYITDDTDWVRDDWRQDSSSTSQDKYNLKVKSIEIDKREKSFASLNSLDGASFRFWVNDSWWSDEFQKLGFPKVEPWEGKIQFKSSKATFTDYNNGNASQPLTYGLYGQHNGSRYYVADLKGAKIDKNNIRKIIKNDPSDPGKAMNLTMEFNEFPEERYSLNEWSRDLYVYVILCNKKMDVPTKRELYDWDYLGLTSGQCIKVWGNTQLSSDGTELILSSRNRETGQGYYQAEFRDFDTGNTIGFDNNNWNNSGYEYDVKLTLDGIERPAGLDVKLQSLFSRFGSLSQGDNNGGDIQRGLESFLDSSNTFTYIVNQGWLNLYDHEGNRFNSIIGSFDVSDTPPATVFIDDNKVTEPASGTASSSYNITLSSAQASDVTFEYKIAANSTASSADYSGLEDGIVTIAAGETSATISVAIEADELAEGQNDEKITIVLSNPVNAVLGRTSADIFIYDPDTNRVVYDDYYGVFDATTSTFTILEGITHQPTYQRLDLPAPITFTTTDWVNNMYKVWGEGEEWEHIDKRELNIYSDELQQDYRITHASMANPDAASKEAGISTTKWSRITVDELPSSLSCIDNCLLGANIKNHYTDAKNQADPNNDNTYTGAISKASPSPMADVGPYIKADIEVTVIHDEGTDNEWTELRQYTKGDHEDGIIESDVVSYTVENNTVIDKDGGKIETGVDFGVPRPGEVIRGSYFLERGTWRQNTEWGLWSGTLLETDDLQYIECDYTTDDDGVKTYDRFHPEYTKANGKINETRYCRDKLWNNDDILVDYNMSIRLEKQYDIYNDDGSKLVLDPPKTLFFRTPNDEDKFGDDADKKFRLDYQGDHLGGIPGEVIDFDTGESLGEYVDQWKDNYRWVQRFQIPDGSILTDSEGTEFLVKALRGEEWLAKKDSAIGTLDNLLNLKTKDDLLTNLDVDWEISQRKETYYDCNITKIRTETYTFVDGDGNTVTETEEFEETDWDACNELEYDSDEWKAAWIVRAEFNNCNERLKYDYDQKAAELAEWRSNAEESGGEYTGPSSPYEDAGWMGDAYTNTYEMVDENGETQTITEEYPANRYGHRAQMSRCKAIGTIPDSLINNGNASVVNGDTVYDPTPNN